MRPFAFLAACALFVSVTASANDSPDTSLATAAPIASALAQPTAATEAVPAITEDAMPVVDLNRDTHKIKPVDLTASDDQIWGRIRKGFGMPDLTGELVDDRMQWYLARPQMLQQMFERGRKYLYHIVGELEKRGMPTELALLPLVESAYNPQALSSARAAGLWQFIPSTGKNYNLTQNWWVDERRDIVASTNAALQYLQSIYEQHGDWQLALASYNWGENAVAKAVAANRAAGLPTDYASLRMPQETRYYVPKLQALKNIIAHPEKYGIKLPDVPNEPYFVTVERTQRMDLALAAKLAEMPVKEFLSLNPGYNRPVIPGSDNAVLVLPVDNARKFKENLANHDEPLVSWKTYSISHSERIEQVARRLKLAAEVLRSANGLPIGARLAAGYTLLVPNSAVTTETITPRAKRPTQVNRTTHGTRVNRNYTPTAHR